MHLENDFYYLTDKGKKYLASDRTLLECIKTVIIRGNDKETITSNLEKLGLTLNLYLFLKLLYTTKSFHEREFDFFTHITNLGTMLKEQFKYAKIKTPKGTKCDHAIIGCSFNDDFYEYHIWDIVFWNININEDLVFEFYPEEESGRDFSDYDNRPESYHGKSTLTDDKII